MTEFLNLDDFDTILDLKPKSSYIATITAAREDETEYGKSIILDFTVPQDQLPPEIAAIAPDGITKLYYGFAFPRVGETMTQRRHNRCVATRNFAKNVLGFDLTKNDWQDLSNWQHQQVQITIKAGKNKNGDAVTMIDGFSRIK